MCYLPHVLVVCLSENGHARYVPGARSALGLFASGLGAPFVAWPDS